MDTSNHSSKPYRVYWLTSPAQRLAAYLDFVETRLPDATSDIQFADVPADPGDQQWDIPIIKAHIQTPEETEWAIQQLLDAGATFSNWQHLPPEQHDDDRPADDMPDPDDQLAPDDQRDDGGYDDSEDDDWDDKFEDDSPALRGDPDDDDGED